MDSIMTCMEGVSGFLWGPWTPWVLLAAGVLFTVWTKFTQYTSMTHGIAVVRGVYDNPDDPGAINHFQALSAALSATVGLGNIGGVALAIGIGGPGALFWMWVVGVFGMALKSVEITLAMMYRNTDDPENPHGGAMWVVDKVLGSKGPGWKKVARAIGVFFCITLLISTFTGGNMFQSWSVARLSEGYFGIPKIGTGILLASLVGLVIIGGIKRIGSVAGKLVPFMCLVYLASALSVLAMHVADIPAMLGLVVKSAFDSTSAGGAFIGGGMGFAFMQGMKRALFSNEAGQGSAPIAHAAAKTDEPAREGIVGGIGPFIDTICICTITALVILLTNTWNREAIGDFKAPVALATTAGTGIWKPSGGSLDSLPGSTDDWVDGSEFYLIGKVEGATHIESERSLAKIGGKIEADESGNLSLKWDDVELKSEEWEGTPTSLTLVDRGIHRAYDGANLTGHAFDREFPGLGKWLVTLAAWLFALSTMISWSYYGEQGVVYIMGNRGVLPYKLLFLVGVIYAAVGIEDTKDMLTLMDLGTGAMLWANIPIVVGMGALSVRCMNNYMVKLKAGRFKRHDARDIIEMAEEEE